ncbi:divergent PAP2 family protein [Alkalibacillus salilacus]|uniref:Acid phosphatase family membrane protein YuiD n=1 Tax=Alkalibacillus salilacus TaxID=284582 RepID=A0ABT9VF14_9BACI|nr:divergent PAP2 family protein [Alkalibacillus salilacus]MDQ0159497.1 acid phosphatase family membrane protein YuiD [Alkalibacillus salilacus]
MVEIFENTPLWIALFAVIFAQVVKIPIQYIATREINLGIAFSTGGMPSSHTAAVASLTTAIGIEHGLNSPLFAIACVLSIIVMYDATGIRRHAGEHATILNQLVKDVQRIVDDAIQWQQKEAHEKQKELKELLGHQPIEVFFGAVTGILLAIITYTYFL